MSIDDVINWNSLLGGAGKVKPSVVPGCRPSQTWSAVCLLTRLGQSGNKGRGLSLRWVKRSWVIVSDDLNVPQACEGAAGCQENIAGDNGIHNGQDLSLIQRTTMDPPPVISVF